MSTTLAELDLSRRLDQPSDLIDAGWIAVQLPLRHRFRGLTTREALLVRGPAGWTEFSPFTEYEGAEVSSWWRAAQEWGSGDPAPPLRASVPVNVTIAVVAPELANEITARSGCTTAKLKIADPNDTETTELARIAAVRDALGPDGNIRVDVNGAWDIDTAERRLRRFASLELEYVEQPCASVEELAELRRRLQRGGVSVAIAADESIRRAADPWRVVELGAADVVVLKVQPLGGVQACLELARRLPIPVVVSSALETSVGLAAGVALAAALPELPYACGLNTASMFTADVSHQRLVAVNGSVPVGRVQPDHDQLMALAAPPDRQRWWADRWRAAGELARRALGEERALAPDRGPAARL